MGLILPLVNCNKLVVFHQNLGDIFWIIHVGFWNWSLSDMVSVVIDKQIELVSVEPFRKALVKNHEHKQWKNVKRSMSTNGNKSVEIVPIDTVNVLKVEHIIDSLNLTIFVPMKFGEYFFQGLKLNDMRIYFGFDCIWLEDLAYFIELNNGPLFFELRNVNGRKLLA